jgi:hypothetical protein
MSKLYKAGRRHRDKAKEQQHKQIAQPMIAKGVGTARVGYRRDDASEADHDQHGACHTDQVNTNR